MVQTRDFFSWFSTKIYSQKSNILNNVAKNLFYGFFMALLYFRLIGSSYKDVAVNTLGVQKGLDVC